MAVATVGWSFVGPLIAVVQGLSRASDPPYPLVAVFLFAMHETAIPDGMLGCVAPMKRIDLLRKVCVFFVFFFVFFYLRYTNSRVAKENTRSDQGDTLGSSHGQAYVDN